jgi:hypothetical protein
MSKRLLRLWAFSIIALSLSCAAKRIPPSYEGVGIEDIIRQREAVRSITAKMSVRMERTDGVLSGDAMLKMTENRLKLRVYSMGMLAAELYEKRGVITSNPPLDAQRGYMIVEGLRGSMLWWSIKGYSVKETDKEYILRNSWRKVVVDRKTMLPLSQFIELEDGSAINVSYGSPKDMGAMWYPSEVSIEFQKYRVDLDIKEISFDMHD